MTDAAAGADFAAGAATDPVAGAAGAPGPLGAPGAAAAPVRSADAREVARRLRAGHALELVCAYDNDTSFAKFPLRGASAFGALRARLPELDPATEIVFYCRCPADKTAVAAARELAARGFTNVKALAGGFAAAVAAGLAG